jgi:hypothetical protein
LTISGPAQPGIFLNSFFQLGVGDLALCVSCGKTNRSDKDSQKNSF